MSLYPVFEKYCEMIEKHGGVVTYTKEEYELKYCEPKEFEPMILTPRNQKRPMRATFENSEKKIPTLKKVRELIGPRPPKTDRKMSPKIVLATLTPEERRERKNAQSRLWRAKKRALKVQASPQDKELQEQKDHKLREQALARYHKNKPPRTRVFYKDLSEEEVAKRRSENKRRSREKAKAQGKVYARKKPTTPEEIEAERARKREWSMRPEQVAKRKAYREAHPMTPEQIAHRKERVKANKKKNPPTPEQVEKMREWKREYAHRPEQVAKRKAYREANKQRLLEYNKEWISKNPEKRKLHQDKSDAKRRGKSHNNCVPSSAQEMSA